MVSRSVYLPNCMRLAACWSADWRAGPALGRSITSGWRGNNRERHRQNQASVTHMRPLATVTKFYVPLDSPTNPAPKLVTPLSDEESKTRETRRESQSRGRGWRRRRGRQRGEGEERGVGYPRRPCLLGLGWEVTGRTYTDSRGFQTVTSQPLGSTT